MTRARALRPYAVGAVGVGAISVLIGVAERRLAISNLSVLYVLFVLLVGSRAGRWPAVATSLLAFVAYDYFFVPPVGTLTVAGPSQLLELALLLGAALVTGQLAASLDRSRAEAAGAAAEARALYGLATEVLRSEEVAAALGLLCERAEQVPAVNACAILVLDQGAPEVLAGRLGQPGDAADAEWAWRERKPLGCALRGGVLEVMRPQPAPADAPAILPLTSGVFVLRTRPAELEAADLRLLAALIALAELLLERRRAAAEADRRRSAEAADRLKGAVLSSLSHELKSPLAALRTGLTALTGASSGLGVEHRELLRGLDRQAIRLDRLVDDLLAMSRLEAGAVPRLEPVSFAETVGAVLERLGPRLGARHVELRLPADLPPVHADELQLERLLANLVENAIAWSSEDGRIEIGAVAGPERVAAWVANDGPDIPPVDLQSVFDRFWTTRREGSGLGLAICRRIVEAHGGTIEARNLRTGPEFRFTLPVARVAALPA